MQGGRVLVTQDSNPAYPGINPAKLQLLGVTQPRQAWREGMYELGSVLSRRMIASFETDAEGYIPSYLSRIEVTHEVGTWGQHGFVTEYRDNGDNTYSLILTEDLDWSAGGTHVIQLRDNHGLPSADGLREVTAGAAKNEVVLANPLDPSVIAHLCTDHQSGREATFYSFGPVDNHSLSLLVTGLRMSANHKVAIQGFIYKEAGVYDVDGDEYFKSATEAELIKQIKVGPAVDNVLAKYVYDAAAGVGRVAVVWNAAPWANLYHVELSSDGGESWTTMEYTKSTNSRFTVPSAMFEEVVYMEAVLCGEVRRPHPTRPTRISRDQNEPAWAPNEFQNKYLKIPSGPHIGRLFKIKKNGTSTLEMFDFLQYPPTEGEYYDIIDKMIPRDWKIAVSAKNTVFGPRTIRPVVLTYAVDTTSGISMAENIGFELRTIKQETPIDGTTVGEAVTVTEHVRADTSGNWFMSGTVIDPTHPSNAVSIGVELSYGDDGVTCYLPGTPRTWTVAGPVSGPSLLLMRVSNSGGVKFLTKVASAPTATQYTLSGNTVTLGSIRNETFQDEDRVYCIMVDDTDAYGVYTALKINEPVTHGNNTTSADLGFTPEHPEEIVLTYATDGAPTARQFTISGQTVTTGVTLVTADTLVVLGLATGGSAEAQRFQCDPFIGNQLPGVPLYPNEVCVVSAGLMRPVRDYTFGFRLTGGSALVSPQVNWTHPLPVPGSQLFAIYMAATLPVPEVDPSPLVVSTSTSFVANTGNHRIEFTGSSNVTCTLPSAVGISGKEFKVKNSGTGLVTIQTSGGTIDGASTFMLQGGLKQSVTLYSNGTNYLVE
jgi:hypothetical protein